MDGRPVLAVPLDDASPATRLGMQEVCYGPAHAHPRPVVLISGLTAEMTYRSNLHPRLSLMKSEEAMWIAVELRPVRPTDSRCCITSAVFRLPIRINVNRKAFVSVGKLANEVNLPNCPQ